MRKLVLSIALLGGILSSDYSGALAQEVFTGYYF